MIKGNKNKEKKMKFFNGRNMKMKYLSKKKS